MTSIGHSADRGSCCSFFAGLAALSSPTTGHGATLSGHVQSGPMPLPSLLVALYATDPSHPDRCAVALAAARTGGAGAFALSYTLPADADAVLYLIADARTETKLDRLGKCRGFAGPVVLASVLGIAGQAAVPADVVVNERTTVAAAYALARFIEGAHIGGKASGLQNAAGMAQNLADVRAGQAAKVLATPPNGDQTETLGSFNSLANMGYAFDGLTRNTAEQIDRSGNVWVTNNWKNHAESAGQSRRLRDRRLHRPGAADRDPADRPAAKTVTRP